MAVHPLSQYYESLFSRRRSEGATLAEAADRAAAAFLDGKPRGSNAHKTTAADRHAAFWTADFLIDLPQDAWAVESMTLSLALYLGQDRHENAALIEHVATVAPEVVRCAARQSGLVVRQQSPRWAEIEQLGETHAAEFAEFVCIFKILDQAHRQREAALARSRQTLAGLTPLDLLIYASLYAFERLVPQALVPADSSPDGVDMQEAWGAINDLLAWKLSTCAPNELQCSDRAIALSMKQHLAPFLFPSREGKIPHKDLCRAFAQAMDAQMELNSFISQSTDAFSYDDSIRFVRNGDRLEIVELDAAHRLTWVGDGEKLTRLHGYWLYRGMDELVGSESTLAMIGRGNLDANLQAFAKAMAVQLQLKEVYGLGTSVLTESGLQIDLFRALLAMELMTAFFIEDFLRPYAAHLAQLEDCHLALGRLAFGGLLQDTMQNRFPVTWSDKAAKVERIKTWTASAASPRGDAEAAEAILDFWTSDWTALSARLRNKEPGLRPELFERPILKMGTHLFQLPWMAALQNNTTAAINNLRRLGSRRMETKEETSRIEQRLGRLFQERGFRVVMNYQPAAMEEADPGEIDLLCARENQLLVLELKSTFVRRSKKDAWVHGTTTLRKAGLQLQCKVKAVRQALTSDDDFALELGFSQSKEAPALVGWIVDTSIEFDHQRFSSFLKISLEEMLVALRDERHLLEDAHGLLQPMPNDHGTGRTLYSNGFSAARFVEVIEGGVVWQRQQP